VRPLAPHAGRAGPHACGRAQLRKRVVCRKVLQPEQLRGHGRHNALAAAARGVLSTANSASPPARRCQLEVLERTRPGPPLGSRPAAQVLPRGAAAGPRALLPFSCTCRRRQAGQLTGGPPDTAHRATPACAPGRRAMGRRGPARLQAAKGEAAEEGGGAQQRQRRKRVEQRGGHRERGQRDQAQRAWHVVQAQQPVWQEPAPRCGAGLARM